ncbi:MAG: hypothetical protein B6D37_09815 [Sphingobacteriales bacterium UTBCD1]|jgi:hypothetical protein|nr:MAG: hypothetical protein B6D37_09815 [Sphingobacteriales bacterium UTBCD1]
MCFPFFKRFTNFTDKYVYWDTNCYRLLGRIANQKCLVWLDAYLKKLKQIERKRKIKVKVSYLVLSEMFAHLNDPIDSNTYLECKHGLYAALYHSDFDSSNLLPNADNEFIKFTTGQAPIADTYRQNSLYNSLLQIHEKRFNDAFIKQNSQTIQLVSDFLNTLKVSWKDSFANHFIKKHDASYSGNWQVFANDKTKRITLLRELRKAKKNDLIYREFGTGMYQYICNNLKDIVPQELTDELLQKIIVRFKPLFALQYRIIELMCQSGYNIDKYINDITDYLIISHLDKGNSIFTSNETKNLVPNLHSLGYTSDVRTLNQYCSALSIPYPK